MPDPLAEVAVILQEILVKRSPWHMLVGCCLLNLTSRKQVDKMYEELFEIWPDPETVIRDGNIMSRASDLDNRVEVRDLLEPLGLGERRFQTIIKLSQTYLPELDRVGYDLYSVDLSNVFGCGDYAKDSWRMFVLGERDLDPSDKELRRYLGLAPRS